MIVTAFDFIGIADAAAAISKIIFFIFVVL
nr:DUF1328 family protein [Cognaticolwellia beringensis]